MKQNGFSYFEVLIALNLILLLLLGSAFLQARVKAIQKAQAYFLIASLQADYLQAALAYTPNYPHLLNNWRTRTSELLPQGQAIIREKQIRISWGGKQIDLCTTTRIASSGCYIRDLRN